MWIKVKLVDGVVCAKFTSSKLLDDEVIQQTGVELMRLIEKASDTGKLLLSFEGIQVMSSAMIGKLVLLNKMAKSRGVQLKFCDIAPNVLEVFKITRLHKVFGILRDEDFEGEDWREDHDEDNGPDNAGVFAKLPKHPSSGGGHAMPPNDGLAE